MKRILPSPFIQGKIPALSLLNGDFAVRYPAPFLTLLIFWL